MKYILNPFTPITISPKSHTRGWALYWARMLGAEILSKDLSGIKHDDEVYIDHGVNFSGSLNLFGGLRDDVAERLVILLKAKPKLYSLDCNMPDYHKMISKRVGQSSCSRLITIDKLEELKAYFSTSRSIRPLDLQKPWLCIGDSHSTSFARHNSAVIRTNGQTLYNFLNHPWNVTEKPYKELSGITIVHGSIDVRHHLARRPDPIQEGIKLITSLVAYTKKIQDVLGIPVELGCPVPVEHEQRKVPKTGYYKKTPFFGALQVRQDITKAMIDCLHKNHDLVVMPPNTWYNMNPEIYAKEIMELGGSVHISPMHYRSVTSWDN
jgi:hypothetical protein